VVKDNAYGTGPPRWPGGACGRSSSLGVATLDEAVELRSLGIRAPILLLGERCPDELPACLDWHLTVSVGERGVLEELARLAQQRGQSVPST